MPGGTEWINPSTTQRGRAIKSNVNAQVIREARITEDATDQVLESRELDKEVQTDVGQDYPLSVLLDEENIKYTFRCCWSGNDFPES